MSVLNDEEKLLIRSLCDKMRLSEKRYCAVSSGFLNEREQSVASESITPDEGINMYFDGGYDGAVRKVAVFIPEYAEEETALISAIRASYYKDYTLSHRDFLGAILGLGLSRDAVGDILVDTENHTADIIVRAEILGFLLESFKTAGRATLSLKEIRLADLHIPLEKTVKITDTVASPRIDAIASSGFSISRENASNLVRSGKLSIDRVICQSPDRQVQSGSVISALGYGKFKVTIPGGLSKKGRIFVEILKYV